MVYYDMLKNMWTSLRCLRHVKEYFWNLLQQYQDEGRMSSFKMFLDFRQYKILDCSIEYHNSLAIAQAISSKLYSFHSIL